LAITWVSPWACCLWLVAKCFRMVLCAAVLGSTVLSVAVGSGVYLEFYLAWGVGVVGCQCVASVFGSSASVPGAALCLVQVSLPPFRLTSVFRHRGWLRTSCGTVLMRGGCNTKFGLGIIGRHASASRSAASQERRRG
jgi:hypothetical protein